MSGLQFGIIWHTLSLTFSVVHFHQNITTFSTLCLRKTRKLWNCIPQNYKDRFWRHLAEIFKRLQNSVCVFQFSCRFAFLINFSSFKPDTKNNADFDARSSKRANFDEVQFLIKHISKFIIFGTYNLQTFRHNTLSNKLLLMQLFFFSIRPKLHRWKWRKLRVTLFRTFSTSPAACWYSYNFYQETSL